MSCLRKLRRQKECNVLLTWCLGMGVGKIPVQLESGEIMRSRPELTTLGRTSKVSGGLVNFLVY